MCDKAVTWEKQVEDGERVHVFTSSRIRCNVAPPCGELETHSAHKKSVNYFHSTS